MTTKQKNQQRKPKVNYKHVLKPLSNKKITKYDFIGFDVETYGNENKFYMGGLYYFEGKNRRQTFKSFYNKVEMIEFMLSNKFKGKYITATNLGFDLTALFYNTKYWNMLNILESGSKIIYADFRGDNYSKKGKIMFIDTMNYAPFSVDKLGKILKVPKLDKPKCIGRLPKNREEDQELLIYNKRDCEISCLFMYFLQDGINTAGGNLKITIASTSFDVWRRNFQPEILIKEQVIKNSKEIKNFIFQGYYGGRTEVYKKGVFKDVHYYDINSLYPSVMRNEFPLPQSVKETPILSEFYINNYFGVTECTIKCPNINKPLLPYRDEERKKLIFPKGTFKGTWNNHELKRALELGYQIIKIHKQIIYTKTFRPFLGFVNYFYNERLTYKKNNNPLELVMKLILNSLYGKFGQKEVKEFKVLDLDTFNGTLEELYKIIGNEYDEKDNKIIMNQKREYDGKNVYPILASYVTTYARLLMYDYINSDDVIYTDTDSIFTKSKIKETSLELGDMKEEDGSPFKYTYFVKPKFYFLIDNEENETTKIKGINRANKDDFFALINGKSVKKQKFSKIKESVRRGLLPNTKIELEKVMSLEDNKREWFKDTNTKDILISEPLEINEK